MPPEFAAMHANFAAVQTTMAVLIFLPSSVGKDKNESTVTIYGLRLPIIVERLNKQIHLTQQRQWDRRYAADNCMWSTVLHCVSKNHPFKITFTITSPDVVRFS